MRVFELRDQLIKDYAKYVTSFINVRDPEIQKYVDQNIEAGVLWPEPLIQLNPSFEPGALIDQLVNEDLLHKECRNIFRRDKDKPEFKGVGRPLKLHKHQVDAIRAARQSYNYVLTTGTGSGKSLSYIIPIVDSVLRRGSGHGIQAIVVYPMNALANSQEGELRKFLHEGYPEGNPPVTFACYTGQEQGQVRQQILSNPPDILLTNYVMLELILTRREETKLIKAAQGLKFLVLDELHTYRGRQGADVALLVRRVRDRLAATELQCVGTSATLSTQGTYKEQLEQVATVATQLFGARVLPEYIIGETLRRSTPERNFESAEYIAQLKQRLLDNNYHPPKIFSDFVIDPLSIWIESAFGITPSQDGTRLERVKPSSIRGAEGAADELSKLTGIEPLACARAIQETLLAGYECEPNPDTGFPPFAFRLHQFISRGDTVYASLDKPTNRYLSLSGQQFVPGNREQVLLPLVFCRECGQEYYCVQRTVETETNKRHFTSRSIFDQLGDKEGEPGYLYRSEDSSWPSNESEIMSRLPDDWLEEYSSGRRVKAARKKYLPGEVKLNLNGYVGGDGQPYQYFAAPFRFCLHCGVAYDFQQSDDFGKLTALNSGGRSSATTILSLTALQALKNDSQLKAEAKKLLSFTDNRQDASLQAGHFNDFVEIGLLRAALYQAVYAAGEQGLMYDQLSQKVYEALGLGLKFYAENPDVKFNQLNETNRALKNIIGYRIYRDLKRGWRVTSPNLEQCDLLEINYSSLEELCEAQEIWVNHANQAQILIQVSPDIRHKVCKVLLDQMRRDLAIKVESLDPIFQDSIKLQSKDRLKAPWAIDEREKMEYASILLPKSRNRDEQDRSFTYLSARGGFGKYLRRKKTFGDQHADLNLGETEKIIRALLKVLEEAGLVEEVLDEKKMGVPGYQIPASAMIWKAGKGNNSFQDPLRMPNASSVGNPPNPFFVNFYQWVASELKGYEAHEHTAQVKAEDRKDREKLFKTAELPVLFCSPTMELGVDIAELNVVNMRNVPPTPANYAQRSGRAGRGGQPALVFTYCTTGSPHDQYFYKRPGQMVAGAVQPPRLDLANRDLIKAHIQAIWLAETGLSLGSSLKDLLDLNGEKPSLNLQEYVKTCLEDPEPIKRARIRAKHVLDSIDAKALEGADWYSDEWLDAIFGTLAKTFEDACERWRSLYLAARAQRDAQHRIISDHSRNQSEKNQAKRLRQEAETQLDLLLEIDNLAQSDFYSYRYFASEGFLPGYNFPRLPLSAYIPARLTKRNDEFLSRPRFLAISEFGPRAIVYHEGTRYRITKAILPVRGDSGEGLLLSKMKLCDNCGYIQPTHNDRCQSCNHLIEQELTALFRMQNVATQRQDRINSDEEERMRMGYEILTGVRYENNRDDLAYQEATLENDSRVIAKLAYGHAANIWRINLGWKHRKKAEKGFLLDTETGAWAKNEQDNGDQDELITTHREKVLPYVEDRRNCLLFEPGEDAVKDEAFMASLQAALKSAIQVHYQLEDNELAAEPLPNRDNRKLILFYEAAEGGAGVLRQLVEDPEAMTKVAKAALDLCHFNPENGDDVHRAPGAKEDCEAACYDCLLSYSNQRDHRILDRKNILATLLEMRDGQMVYKASATTHSDLLNALSSDLQAPIEKRWLGFLDERNCTLPGRSHFLIESCQARPDFVYEDSSTLVYVDGAETVRQARDREKIESLEYDFGYTVIRFGAEEEWEA
ncbi:MAG: DEAD/DEAH box helicase, partial [Chloroflexota bacterium]